MNNTARKISGGQLALMIVAGLVWFAAIVTLFCFQGFSVVKWWIPLLVSLVLSAISGTVIWRLWIPMSRFNTFVPNYIVNTIFFTVLLTASFYLLNYFVASNRPPQKESVYIEQKYSEKHYRSNRTGRHSYTRGPAYYEYYIKVKFEDGVEKDIQLPYSTYKNLRSESNITLSYAPGIFGIKVIRPNDIPIDNPYKESPKKKRRCRFFGTSGRKFPKD